MADPISIPSKKIMEGTKKQIKEILDSLHLGGKSQHRLCAGVKGIQMNKLCPHFHEDHSLHETALWIEINKILNPG